ncbi:MAG: single-stranded-DNA-specific exonuclease RecJ [Candidatus Woesebacteria bacterium]|nr:single-stranded-DNA-specific exonuclease RecJ [Candidatus Woesebacteria bacterium]
MRWEVLHKSLITSHQLLIDVLLKNRGIRNKKEFFNPTDPMKISLKSLGIRGSEVKKAIGRIKKAKKSGEHVIIYGDYDADGITGTATMWETLHDLGIFVLPHIPERFSEGYGLNLESVKKLKKEDPELGLIITVDHGIVAGEKVDEVKKLGIDMIITDHHQAGKKMPKPLALIYTTKIGGSALAWFFAREIVNSFKLTRSDLVSRLELAAIGTIADQLSLIGPNRSVVKYGLTILNHTKRPGLLALFEEAGLTEIGPYEVGFMIAPRINSMGRLKHGLESLRLLCTRDKVKALQIAGNVGRTNRERQKIVDEVVAHARNSYKSIEKQYVIVLAHESYHEGVIGLAAAKLVEEFYRPAIVLSKKGDTAKASARSISGFNIIEAIRKLEKLYIEGGGHPMAAGFSIKTENIDIFTKEINKIAGRLITEDILERKVKIDLELNFKEINTELVECIKEFEPTGLGNPSPTFFGEKVEILDAKTVGRDAKHLKLKLKQDEQVFDSIFFGGGEIYSKLTPGADIDIAYQVEENLWNGYKNIQLKVKDIKTTN